MKPLANCDGCSAARIRAAPPPPRDHSHPPPSALYRERTQAKLPEYPARHEPASTAYTTADTRRLEAFSDGVIAIIITILVLELHVPAFERGHLLEALLSLGTMFFAFLISFVYIGVIRLNHHGIFRHIRFVDQGLHWINLGSLLTCALLPFPTNVLADALREGNVADQHVAAAFYAVVAGLMSAAWLPLFPYLRDHPELAEPGAETAFFHAQRLCPWTGVVCYGVAIGVRFWSTPLALRIFAFMVAFQALTSEGIHAFGFLRHAKARRSDKTEQPA
jgi:uncharacterized membrane protein